MTEEHMRLIVRWIRNLEEEDPVFEGAIKEDMILDKEETEHTMIEKCAHQQCHLAMTDAGFAPENMDDKLKMAQDSRFGWMPHTLIFKWLAEVWGKAFTT
eukprot:4765798-Heterocapsa_arctica.AAC.1